MICNHFIHIHMPRTGGSLFRYTLEQFIAQGRIQMLHTDAHVPLSRARHIAPPGTPSFAFVRNPWAWYPSRFNRAVAFATFAGSFTDYIHAAYYRDPERLRMSKVWAYFTDPGVTHIGRFEHLIPELCRIMVLCWPDVPLTEFRQGLLDRGRVRASIYSQPWHAYYTPELVEMVAEMDEELIERFGYTWEGDDATD